jgi:hypothetical protein
MSQTIVYMIQSKDGQFSSGGTYPRWGRKGKIWRQRGHLSNHLAQSGSHGRQFYTAGGAKVVEYMLTQEPKNAYPIAEYIEAVDKRRNERQNKHKVREYEDLLARQERERQEMWRKIHYDKA